MLTTKKRNEFVYLAFLVWVIASLSPFSFAMAGEPEVPKIAAPQKAASSQVDPEKLKNRIKEIKKKLAGLDAKDSDQTLRRFGLDLSKLQSHINKLRELEAVYQRQLTTKKTIESLKIEAINLSKELSSQPQSLFAHPPPYNLSEYDSLLDHLNTSGKEEETLLINLKSVKKALEEDKILLEQASKKVREITEELQKKENSEKSLLLGWDLDHAKVEEELAQAFVDLKRMLIENLEAERQLAHGKTENTQSQVDLVRSELAFDPDDLSWQLATLEGQRIAFQSRIDTLKAEQAAIDREWVAAQENYEKVQGDNETAVNKAKTHLEAREAWRETYRKVLEQTENMLITLSQEMQLWQKRYAIIDERFDYADLDNWQNDARGDIKNIRDLVKVNENYRSELQAEIVAIQKTLAEEHLDPAIKENVETRVSALRKMAERIFEYLSLLQGASRTEDRFLEEIGLTKTDMALREKIKTIGTELEKVWGFELWVVDERAVTVKKVVVALFILVVGMLLAGWVAHSIVRRLLLKSRLDDTATAAVEKILFFVVLLILVIFALRSVNIPITVFTFLGGALAIGTGFGTQNLMNNFFSGLILLL